MKVITGSTQELIEWVKVSELIQAIEYLLEELNKPNGADKNVPCAKRVLKEVLAKFKAQQK